MKSAIQCIPARSMSFSCMDDMTSTQNFQTKKFLREPRGKLLICVECGKSNKECQCDDSSDLG